MAADGDSGDSSTAGEAVASATVHIRLSNGSRFSVEADLKVTAGDFKDLIADKCDVPAQQQRLIYKGRILKDEQTLESYGLESGHTIHLVRSVLSSVTSNISAPSQGGSAINHNVAPGSGVGSSDGGLSGTGLDGSLFPGLGTNVLLGTGTSGLFGTGLPEFDQVQQQLTENPNIMRYILNMPAIQILMNSPDLIRNLIMSNPQMREMLDRNPELAHVLNDPNTLRQTLEAARNPELMREMMRNTDRAMSNIESSPEGFNMLRRMYETVQEPFLNATTMTENTGSNVGSNSFAALLRNQGSNQPRDWPSNAPSAASDQQDGSTSPNTNPLPNPWNNDGSQTTNTRSTAVNDARTGGISGLGRIPELERMAGSIANPSVLTEDLQNPAMAQMMQSLLSNPQYINQVRTMIESNTQFGEMMQNQEFLRQLSSPETLQQILSLQQSLFRQVGQQPSSQVQSQTNDATGMDFLMQMFGGLGAGGNLGVPGNPSVPPEELYATQLAQLQEMGFFDTQENLRVLIATAGNVHAAVERLLGNMGH